MSIKEKSFIVRSLPPNLEQFGKNSPIYFFTRRPLFLFPLGKASVGLSSCVEKNSLTCLSCCCWGNATVLPFPHAWIQKARPFWKCVDDKKRPRLIDQSPTDNTWARTATFFLTSNGWSSKNNPRRLNSDKKICFWSLKAEVRNVDNLKNVSFVLFLPWSHKS